MSVSVGSGSTVTGSAPGVPRVGSSRFDVEGAHTLEGYRSSGSYEGYAGLRAALAMSPAEVMGLVKDATLLGRGGAGFPAGVKWGFCPPGVWPPYLVVNGDESAAGPYAPTSPPAAARASAPRRSSSTSAARCPTRRSGSPPR